MTSNTGRCAPPAQALFATDVDVGKGMTDLLVKYLVKDGTYSVIEHKTLDKINPVSTVGGSRYKIIETSAN